MTREWFTPKEVAGQGGLPKSVQGVIKSAAREAWQSRPRQGKGGGKEYHISSLPMETQVALMTLAERNQPATTDQSETAGYPYNIEESVLVPVVVAPAVKAEVRPTRPTKSIRPARAMRPVVRQTENILPQKKRSKAYAKADLLVHYLRYLKEAPRGRKAAARETFIKDYNSGQLYPTLFTKLGKTSWKSIERWKKTLENSGDSHSLADDRGSCLKGRSSLTQLQADTVLSCVLNPNAPKISEAIRMAKRLLKARGIADSNGESAYRRHIESWRSTHDHIWNFQRGGEQAYELNNAYTITRDFDAIEVGDILVADGHVLNFEILNPWTGKPKRMMMVLFYDMKSNMPLGWEIMPTENTQAISAALRRSIIALGKYPKSVYLDNGKAFRARFFSGCENFEELGFTGIYAQFGIQTIYAWPYHGQSKTVERFFGTFHELETWMPSYVGNSIEHKPPRMNRGEKLHRRVWDKATGGICPTMEQAHNAIAAWFDEYAARPQRGHLAGACPNDIYIPGQGPGVNIEDLRLLMLSREIKTVRKLGITFNGVNYYHPELHGLRHAVQIRYDLTAPGSILVYDSDGRFFCEATPPAKVHPAAHHLGNKEDRQLLTEQLKIKQSLKKETTTLARRMLEEEILPDYKRQLETVGICTDEAKNSEHKSGARKKAEMPEIPVLMDAAEIEKELAVLSEHNQPEAYDIFADIERLDGDEKYEKLMEVEVRGLLMPSHHQAWMRYFEQTPAYANNLDHYESLRGQMAVAWQCEVAESV